MIIIEENRPVNQKPSLKAILFNDPWAAPALGACVASLVMTMIILGLNQLMKMDSTHPRPFLLMTLVFACIAMATALLRIPFVNRMFDHGAIVRGEITEARAIKTNLYMTIRFAYLGVDYVRKYQQIITRKTLNLRNATEVSLLVDPQQPERILLMDVYL